MYDEVIRQQDHLWTSLTYAHEEGMRLGIEQGKENTIISLFKKGYINKELAAEELKIDVKELDEYLY